MNLKPSLLLHPPQIAIAFLIGGNIIWIKTVKYRSKSMLRFIGPRLFTNLFLISCMYLDQVVSSYRLHLKVSNGISILLYVD